MNKQENHDFPEALSHEPDADELEAVWSALEAAHDSSPVSAERTDAAWDALSASLGLDIDGRTSTGPDLQSAHDGRGETLRPSGTPWLRIAAAVTVLLGGLAVWQQIPVTHQAPAGERLAVTLPDGSGVELNAGSSLSLRRGFDFLPGVPQGSRVVRLEGEAFFDVTPGERPFEVLAGPARVTVLGTRFNVRARTVMGVPPVVRVDVEEGRVRVAADDAETELSAGESVRVEGGADELAPTRIPADRIAPWRAGGLTVNDETLAAVVREVGIRFGTDVQLAPDVDGSVRVTAFYPLLTGIESVLRDLATQQSLRVRQTSEGWELF